MCICYDFHLFRFVLGLQRTFVCILVSYFYITRLVCASWQPVYVHLCICWAFQSILFLVVPCSALKSVRINVIQL